MAEQLYIPEGANKQEKYEALIPQIKGLLSTEENLVAGLGNLMAVLKYGMQFFWVGMYIVEEDQLVLGPFQGPLACTRIPKGKGVCGTSWEKGEVLIVDDVDAFPGHIACSSLSKSEIVLPVRNVDGEIRMVFDIDSDAFGDFDQTDETYLTQIVNIVEEVYLS